jgi:hypothetical protein
LRDMGMLGGTAERTGIGHSAEVTKLMQFHKRQSIHCRDALRPKLATDSSLKRPRHFEPNWRAKPKLQVLEAFGF